MRIVSALPAFVAGLVASACIVADPNHCENMANSSFCAANHPSLPVCSRCALSSANNGCVATLDNDSCVSQHTSADSVDSTTDTTSPTSTTTTDTTTGTTTTASATEPTTSTTVATEGTTASTTTDATTDATATTDGTMTGGPMCGNNVKEDGEVCDGTDLDGLTCIDNSTFAGGQLGCSDDCNALDYSMCCYGLGQDCGLINDNCCEGTCLLDMCQ